MFYLCAGVLWITNDIINGSEKVMNRFQELGKQIYFVTNNSTKTRLEFLEKAHRLGFNITEDGIISTAYATAKYLQNRNFTKKVYLVGTTGIANELDNVGIRHTAPGPDVTTNIQNLFAEFKPDAEIGAVVVGFDEHLSFPKMYKAATYLSNPDCLFIGTNTDERFPSTNGIVPGTGAIVRAIETCAERKATIMGKPNKSICESLINGHIIVPERTLMIGDRANTDILLGTNCGFQTLLVGTGVHSLDDVKRWQESNSNDDKKLLPDVYLPRLGDLLPFLN